MNTHAQRHPKKGPWLGFIANNSLLLMALVYVFMGGLPPWVLLSTQAAILVAVVAHCVRKDRAERALHAAATKGSA